MSAVSANLGLLGTRPPLKIRCDSTVARGGREGLRATTLNRTRVTGSTAHAALMTQQTLWRRIRPAYTGPSIHLHFTLSHPALIIWAFCLCSGCGWEGGERERQNGGGLVYVLFQYEWRMKPQPPVPGRGDFFFFFWRHPEKELWSHLSIMVSFMLFPLSHRRRQ